MENAAVNEEVKENVQAQPQEEQGSTIEEITQEALNKLDKSIEFCEKLKATIKADSANANCAAAGIECFSEGSEPIEFASPVPPARMAITIATRHSVLMMMAPSSPHKLTRSS